MTDKNQPLTKERFIQNLILTMLEKHDPGSLYIKDTIDKACKIANLVQENMEAERPGKYDEDDCNAVIALKNLVDYIEENYTNKGYCVHLNQSPEYKNAFWHVYPDKFVVKERK